MRSVALRTVVALVSAAAVLVWGAGVAHATFAPATVVRFNADAPVSLGQTNVPGTIELRNDNTLDHVNDTNEVCNANQQVGFCGGDEGITLIPSCGMLSADDCAPGGEDPGVFDLSATGTGRANSACAGMVFDITEIDPTTGKVLFTPQNQGVVTMTPAARSCIIDFTFDVVKLPTIDLEPGTPGLQTAQITRHFQYISQKEQAAEARDTGVTTVQLPVPTITTTASPSVVIGGQVTDTATVTGRFAPVAGASVEFRLYGPDDATCATAPVFTSTQPYPAAGGPVSSAAFTPAVAGTYRWRATYTGDANNAPVTGACNAPNESVVVTRATPTITTAAFISSTDQGLGGFVVDTATVAGRVSPQSGATVEFRLFGPDDTTCATPPVFTSRVAYPVGGGSVTSETFTPGSPGRYRWRALYSGDVNNAPVEGACNDPGETIVVRARPTLSTTASAGVVVGSAGLSDSATLTGLHDPVPNAVLRFLLYGPGDDGCTGAAVFQSPDIAVPASGGPVTSPSFTPMQAGVYRWRAVYDGDANNVGAAGVCGDPAETVTVAKATPVLTPGLPPDIVLGADSTQTGAVAGIVSPAGGTLGFAAYGPAVSIGQTQNEAMCAGAPVFQTTTPYGVAGTVAGATFTPPRAGTYGWRVSYSGDANNNAVASTCAVVNVVAPTPIPNAGPTLPATGTDPLLLVRLACVAIGAGALLLEIARRRRVA